MRYFNSLAIYFKQKYKNILKIIKDYKNKKQLFNSIQPGEMIWAQMPLCKKELNKIAIDHRIRPYLILKKDKKFLYAYPSSSKHAKKLNSIQEYCINSTRYQTPKNSYINLTTLVKIPISNIKSKFTNLISHDLQNIEKRLKVFANHSSQFNIPFNLNEGDIINNHSQLYYVYTSDNTNLYAYTIYKKVKKHKKLIKVIINGKSYYFDFNNKRILRKSEKNDIVDIASKDVRKQIKLYQENLKPKRTPDTNEKQEAIQNIDFDIGTVFKIGNMKVMYLFKRNDINYGVDLLLYKISPFLVEINQINTLQFHSTNMLLHLPDTHLCPIFPLHMQDQRSINLPRRQ